MEPTLLAVGNSSTQALHSFSRDETVPARTVLVDSQREELERLEPDRRISVGFNSSPPDRLMRPNWSSGRDELRDEVERTDFVLLLTHLDGQPETYLSRYVADLVQESNTVFFSVVAGRFEESDGLPGRRIRSTGRDLEDRSDFFLPVHAEPFTVRPEDPDASLSTYLGNLVGKIVNRIRHGNDVIGNLESLVHGSDRSKTLLKKAATAGQSLD